MTHKDAGQAGSAEQVQRWRREGDCYYQCDAAGNFIYFDVDVPGQSEPQRARRMRFSDSSVSPIILASDYDRLSAENATLRAERLRWIVQLLKVRDEYAKGDYAEAWHQLYQIASPDFTKLEPWAEFEAEAAALSPDRKGP
jgi:hypothetical protein